MSSIRKLKGSAPAASSAPELAANEADEGSMDEATTSLDDLAIDTSDNSDKGKVMQLLGILRKVLNVKDIANVRISLPAQLLEPIGQLESWTYHSRPDFLAAVGESDDELERMVACLRFAFTKDSIFVQHKIMKPYNSTLGEFFRCTYDVHPVELDPSGVPQPADNLNLNPSSEIVANAGKPSKSATPSATASSAASIKSTSAKSAKSGAGSVKETKPTRVAFINEQVSHHPPVSYYHVESRGPKGTVVLRGCDHISAKFTGAVVKVFPGPKNFGLFVDLPDRGESYRITHPMAAVAGLLRGSPYATIGESTTITCTGKDGRQTGHYRTIISYTEESWLRAAKYALEGVIYKVQDESELEWTKAKQVPPDRVVASCEGCWRGEVRWKAPGDPKPKVLLNMVPLAVAPKTVAPLEQQDAHETRRIWAGVTEALLARNYGLASRRKQALEQEQRDKAEERKRAGEEHRPRFYEAEGEGWDGRPVLSAEGRSALDKLFEGAQA